MVPVHKGHMVRGVLVDTEVFGTQSPVKIGREPRERMEIQVLPVVREILEGREVRVVLELLEELGDQVLLLYLSQQLLTLLFHLIILVKQLRAVLVDKVVLGDPVDPVVLGVLEVLVVLEVQAAEAAEVAAAAQ